MDIDCKYFRDIEDHVQNAAYLSSYCMIIVPIAVQRWIRSEQQCLVKNADCNTQVIALIAYM